MKLKIVFILLICFLLTGCEMLLSVPGISESTSAVVENYDSLEGVYQLAVSNGFVGTYEDWLDFIKGPQGEKGESGKDGTSLLTGTNKPSNDLGKVGDSYINLTTWDYFVKTENSWELKGNIKGEQGESNNGSDEYLGLDFYPINDKECAVSINKSSFLKEVVIPSKYKNYVVTTLCREYQARVPDVESVILPNTITKIESRVFENYTNLKSITIPKSVVTIEEGAFLFCTNLTSIEFAEGSMLREIGDNVFFYCEKLKNINIPNNVSTLGGLLFTGCKNLESVTIPSSVINMGEELFGDCNSINIYCALKSKPSRWPSNWNSGQTVYWEN